MATHTRAAENLALAANADTVNRSPPCLRQRLQGSTGTYRRPAAPVGSPRGSLGEHGV